MEKLVDYTVGDVIDVIPILPKTPDKKPRTISDDQIANIAHSLHSNRPHKLANEERYDKLSEKVLRLITDLSSKDIQVGFLGMSIFVAGDLAFKIVNGPQYREVGCMWISLLKKVVKYQFNTIGLVFLCPVRIYTVNVVDWNYNAFLKRIASMTVEVPDLINIKLDRAIEYLGSHIPKQRTFYKTVLVGTEYPSVQFFAGEIKTENFEDVYDLVEEYNLPCFIHTPYSPPNSVNLSNRASINKVKKELELCEKCGFRGVVVHTARGTSDSPVNLVTNMRNNIQLLCDSTSSNVILETPAAQTGETLPSITEFVEFVKSVERDNLKICVDTAHVWAAGYDPLFYILYVERELPNELILVHINNSKSHKCGRRDLHESITKGMIPIQIMLNVISYCILNDIPMIVE